MSIIQRMTMRPVLAIAMTSLLGLAFSCSGSTPKPESAASAAAEEGDSGTESVADDPLRTDETEGESQGGDESAATPASDGELTLEDIAKIVKGKRQVVRDCYDAERKKDPSLKGSLTIHFVVDPEGHVMSAELNEERSDIKSPAVVECAVKLIKGLTFPASARGMEKVVNYPFDLQPQ